MRRRAVDAAAKTGDIGSLPRPPELINSWYAGNGGKAVAVTDLQQFVNLCSEGLFGGHPVHMPRDLQTPMESAA